MARTWHGVVWAAGVILALGALAPEATWAATQTLAISGDSAPGTGGGTFWYLHDPVLNASGQAAFLASLTGTSDGSSQGIFRGDGSTTVAIAREKGSAPGLGEGTFYGFHDPALNASGQAAFYAVLTDTSDGSTRGIFRGDGSTPTAIAREKWPAPGTGGGTFLGELWSFYDPVLNASGQAAFLTDLTGTSDGSRLGIFRGDGSTATAIARDTWPAPGTGGGTFREWAFLPTVLNASGQAAFVGWLVGTSDGTAEGIFRGDGSTTTAIARDTWPAPGTGGGTFWYLHDPVLNASGQAAFYADLLGTYDGSTVGIFRGDGSTPTAIAREKWVAPGTGGGTFLSFGYPVLNASGQAAFFAPLRDTSDGSTCGIFRGDGSTTVAIAREKWVAPGTGGGTFLSFGHPALNASGQAAFLADLTGTVGGTADNAGIFLADDQERIVAVRKGDALAGSTITWLSFLGGQDRGNRTGLNDYGQVAYGAYLADGRQGVFLFTPELHWRAASSGNWDAGANWTVGIAPAAVHTVTIDPTSNLTVTGPILASTIKTLTVGAKTYGQTATLNLTSATGALTVAGAAAVQTAGCINVSAGTFTAGSLTNDGTFFVDVAGAASLGSLLNTGAATVGGAVTVSGGAENDGTMTVQSGGTLTAAGGLTNLGNLNLQSATLAGGTVTNDYGASMNAKGTVSTALVNNGSLSLTGVLTVLGTATNAGTVTAGLGQNLRLPGGLMNSGLISLQGGALSGLGLVVNQAAGIIRGGGGISTQFFNYGSIEVENSRTLTVSEGFGSSGVIALGGPLAVLAGGEVTNTGAILGQGQVSADVVNSGTIQATQGTLRLAGNLTNDEGGLIEVLQDATAFVTHGLATNSGTTILRAGTFDNGRHLVTNSGTITGHGTLRTGGLTNAPGRNIGVGGGDLDVIGPVTNDGTVTTQGGCTTTFYNRVNGDGSFPGTGTVVFLDGFSPGHSPAAISFGGNVVFGSAGRFVAELGGTTPGTEYDQANVAGAATLGGTLEVSLVDGFRPAHNDTFQVMTFGSRAGTFPSATGLDRGSRLTLEPAYSSTDLALAAVQGGSGAWRFDTNGSASVPANWTGGIPNGLGDTATFGPVIQAPREVTVDAATVLTAMVFDSAKAYTVAGPGTVTLNAGGDSATISVTGASGAANHIISAPLTLLSALDIDNEATGDLAFAGGLNDLAGQTITKIGQGPVTFEGPLTFGAGSLLMVYDGTVNLNSDAGSDLAANLSIDVMDATVNFGHDQHLDWLTIGDGGKVVFTGARVVVLNHLVMDGLALGSTTLTPEPATLALVALGWAFLAGRRRRRGR